jgi:hypothetical protein
MIARAANNNAYSELISCCEDEVSFSIVDAAITDALPSGDARLAWKNLVARYEPTTSVTLVQLKKEFTNCILEDVSENPEIWITKLEQLRQKLNRLNAPISDLDLMIHILNNLLLAYESLIEKLEDKINDPNDPLTVQILTSQLKLKFQRISEKVKKTEKEEELALLSKGGFKGTCRVCGKYGHKGTACWFKNATEKK